MASIQKRERNGKVTWRVQWRDPSGNLRSRVFDREGTTKKPGAKQFKAEIEQSLHTGHYYDVERGKYPLGQWAQLWLETKADITDSTRERYAGIIRTHIDPHWADVPLASVTHAQVQQWISRLSIAPASIHKTHRVLSLMLDWAVEDDRLTKNPAKKITLPRLEDDEQRYLNYHQLEELADRCGPEWRLIVLVLGYTGLRWGELAALRAGRIDMVRRRINIIDSVTPVNKKGLQWGGTKNHQRRAVPVPAFLVDELRGHLADLKPQDLAFRGPRGGILRAQVFTRASFQQAAVDMGLCEWQSDPTDEDPARMMPVDILHLHELRHTAASLAIASGADVKVIQRMLGHKDATMTLNQYGHLFDDNLDVVTDAMSTARHRALSLE